MATTIRTHAREWVGRNRVGSRLAGAVGNHLTLCVGILYVFAISIILAFVARP